MTRDEIDPAWWADVKKIGWLVIDYGPNGEDSGMGKPFEAIGQICGTFLVQRI